jgi:hypothetical protein
MATSIYIQCFLAGTLGALLHLFAIKVPAMKERAKVANEKFDLSDYLKDDLAAILSNLLTVLILLLVLDEVVKFKPVVEPYLKAGFVFVGFTGSSILISILGRAQKKLNSVVDEKTDIADGKK